MSDYISRDAAIQALCKLCLANGNCGHTCREILALKSLPAANVRPVVRGKWEPGDSRNVTAVCSNCGRLRLGNGAEWATKLANFCEKCGADMRPEEGET